MTSISNASASPIANFERLQSLVGDPKFIDIRNMSASSAVSDFAFRTVDTDKDASLSIEEFAALGKKQPSDANAQALFAASDRDNDGKLNALEVRASGLLSPGNVQAMLGIDNLGEWLVSQADGDGDGALSVEEYTESRGAGPFTAMMKVGPNGEQLEVRGSRLDVAPGVLRSMDADEDGKLSAAELNDYMTPGEGYAAYRPSAGAERMPDQLIARNDADGDGALSAEELMHATEAPTYEGTDDTAEAAKTLVGVADTNKDGKVSSDEFSALAAQSRLTPFYAQSEPEAVSRLMLSRLLQSSFAQLQNDFVSPVRTDVTA